MTSPTEDLRAKLDAMTPGEWEADRDGYRAESLGWATILAPDGAVLFDSSNGSKVLLEDPDGEGDWRDVVGDANAAGIVLSVNLARALVREETVEELARVFAPDAFDIDSPVQDDTAGRFQGRDAARDLARIAIAYLSSKAVGHE